jgi:hypothetical protein
MADWKDYKDQTVWELIPFDQQVNKGLGPWAFTPQSCKPKYNEGNYISTAEDPTWDLENHGIVPITPTHNPCGYWPKGYSPYNPVFLTSRIYPIECIEASESIDLLPTRMYLSGYDTLPEATEVDDLTITTGTLVQTFFLETYEMLPEATEAIVPIIISGYLEISFELISYSMLPEATESNGAIITSGYLELDFTLVEYVNYLPEATDSLGAIVTGGTLEEE